MIPPPRHADPDPVLEVIHRGRAYVAINKPSGVLSVPGKNPAVPNCVELCRRMFPDATGPMVIHRLDMETSGILLLAKKRSALTALQDQFRARDTGKTYLALVAGTWPKNLKVIDQPLLKTLDAAGERHVRVASPANEDARRSITVIRRIEPHGEFTLLEIGLKTGRTHQIRVHLSHLGWPIVGDDMYGGKPFVIAKKAVLERQALHAAVLGIRHPVTEQPLQFTAPLRGDLAAIVLHLREVCGKSGTHEVHTPPGATVDVKV